MAKTMTFKSLIAVVLITAGFQVSFAQPTAFWSENFNSSANWVHGGTNAGTQVWNWTTDLSAGYQRNGEVPAFGANSGSTGYFYFDSDANQENDHDVTLTGTGAPANCAGKTNVHLRFYTQYFYFNDGAIAEVGVSANGGAFNYTQILPSLLIDQIAEGFVDIPLPAADNQASVVIQFRWIGNFEYHWKIDDAILYELVTPVHDVTFQVDASNLSVDPGGMQLAGTFSNWADQAMTNVGNGIWSITLPLEEGSAHQYKFKNGPNNWEQGQAACGVDDNNGGFNRTLSVGTADVTLPTVCFNACTPCIITCPINPNKIVCDYMEQYNTTQKLAQQNVAQNGAANSWWTTWSGATGTAEDGIVTTEQANSLPNSFKIISPTASGGPQDVVLKLGNRTTGRYELKWMCYIPAGKQGYYNVQNVVPIAGGAWNLDVFFEAAGGGHIQIGAGASLATFNYPNAEWFEVKHIIDLDNNFLTLWVNGQYVHKMAYPNNLGGVDYYGINENHLFYIDDVECISLPPLVYNVDICDGAVDLSLYFGQTVTQTTGLYDNTNATTTTSDPTVECWGEVTPGVDILNTTMWYTFVGDGRKYHIETVPCSATNYIGSVQQDPGDTQMLIYGGDNCNDLTEIVCNDDLYPTGIPDWRAGVDLETVAGKNYYMLIDGFEFQGVVALGEYCIQISQVPSVLCADGAVGAYETSSQYLCEGTNLADLITISPTGFVIPNEGPVFGLAWAITSAPIPANTWPNTVQGLLVGSTGFLPDPFVVGYVNDGDPFPANLYYITPIVLGGGTDTDLANGATLFDTDPGTGCFFNGVSTPVVFLPLTDDISATATTGAGLVDLTPAGGIGALIGDESSYSYNWSNGATTQDLSGVSAGTYTCTVSDECSNPFVLTVQVSVGTSDPASIQSFVVSPNPSSGLVTLSLTLATAADVRIEVLNTLGQTLQTINAGKMSTLNQNIDLSNGIQGTYFLRITVDGETAIRRIVLQR